MLGIQHCCSWVPVILLSALYFCLALVGRELSEEFVWSEEWCFCVSCELERCEHGSVTHARLLLKMILCW